MEPNIQQVVLYLLLAVNGIETIYYMYFYNRTRQKFNKSFNLNSITCLFVIQCCASVSIIITLMLSIFTIGLSAQQLEALLKQPLVLTAKSINNSCLIFITFEVMRFPFLVSDRQTGTITLPFNCVWDPYKNEKKYWLAFYSIIFVLVSLLFVLSYMQQQIDWLISFLAVISVVLIFTNIYNVVGVLQYKKLKHKRLEITKQLAKSTTIIFYTIIILSSLILLEIVGTVMQKIFVNDINASEKIQTVVIIIVRVKIIAIFLLPYLIYLVQKATCVLLEFSESTVSLIDPNEQ